MAYAEGIRNASRAGSEFTVYIGRSSGNIARSVDTARGNGVAFNGGRGTAVGEGRAIFIALHFIEDHRISFAVGAAGNLVRNGLGNYGLDLRSAVGNIAIVTGNVILNTGTSIVQDGIFGLINNIATGNGCTIGLSRSCR